MTYPYVQAKWDYGPTRKATRGLMYHMAEGGNTVFYLSTKGTAPRGVSVHAVCETSGRVVQMLPWGHVSGSLNPDDRSVDTGYYGHTALVEVLGDLWWDPNQAVISMEIEGFAKDGPNDAQVAAAVAWGRDMKRMYPSLRGALGHTDQTDTKPCPGLSAAMKAIFTGVGGHGLWTETTTMGLPFTLPNDVAVAGKLAIPAGADAINVARWTPTDPASAHYKVPTGVTRPAYLVSLSGPNSGKGYIVDLNGDQAHFVRESVGTFTPSAAPVVDDQRVREEVVNAARAAVSKADSEIAALAS